MDVPLNLKRTSSSPITSRLLPSWLPRDPLAARWAEPPPSSHVAPLNMPNTGEHGYGCSTCSGDGCVSDRVRYLGNLMQGWHESGPTVDVGHTEAAVETDSNYEYGPSLVHTDASLPIALPPNSDNAVIKGDGGQFNYSAMDAACLGTAAATGSYTPRNVPDPADERNGEYDLFQSGAPPLTEELAGASGSLEANTGQQTRSGATPAPPLEPVGLPQGFAAMYWNGQMVVYRTDDGTVNATQAVQGIGMTLRQMHYRMGGKRERNFPHYALRGCNNFAGTYMGLDDIQRVLGPAGTDLINRLRALV
ncbi:hypothetical protein QBC46DRAFT_407838 [Diplogelasinospora grovesii]|uniref:Uncharacterized protein n=1 Tax=Diplogelasinospora grovesii TaxID=303347 RepID=A0AAN6N877_9PEZI|nr:hypothetical protein QBC46DRAFT_407838 [Diplogelasinospora grovesii]